MADTADMSKSEVVDRWEATKKRAAELSKKIGHGVKPTAMAAAGGAGAYFVEKSLGNVDALKGKYRKGLAMVVAGHLLKKKSHDLGTGLAFLGGYMLARDYDQGQAATSATVQAGGATATATKPAGALEDAFTPAMGLVDVSGLVDLAA